MKIDILQFFVTGVTTLNQGHISAVYAHHLCAVSVILFHVYTFGIFAVLRANVTSGFRPQPIALVLFLIAMDHGKQGTYIF